MHSQLGMFKSVESKIKTLSTDKPLHDIAVVQEKQINLLLFSNQLVIYPLHNCKHAASKFKQFINGHNVSNRLSFLHIVFAYIYMESIFSKESTQLQLI